MERALKKILDEPFRLLFPLGILYLLAGSLLWVPQLWAPGDYPVLTHRYLMLSGFAASFIGGFLMTAVPRFSKTIHATLPEVLVFSVLAPVGLFLALQERETASSSVSALQPLVLLAFLFRRIFQRQENPPYSFVFIFVGLALWVLAASLQAFAPSDAWSRLHYEGALMAIILGVGSRLIPGILGHVEIVGAQRAAYERPVPILSTIPSMFLTLIAAFVGSYLLPEWPGALLRLGVVAYVAMAYWVLWRLPRTRSSLTIQLWIAAWLIVASFLLRVVWPDGVIHAGHAFFITGVVFLCLLVATRVIQSHGPKDKALEDSRVLHVVGGLLVVAAATRISAVLQPEHYLRHLAYSALCLVTAVLVWSGKYLKHVRTVT